MGAMRGGAERGGAGGGGEIVQVQGGHILRSIGRKDRHSKVYTAKGPRDRRVRLSAHTAIQFYDVQDRLGYDRPSKAVDWLIKNAKSAIDKLAQLPPWYPNPNPTQYSNNDEDLVLPTAETAATRSQSGVPEEELESSDFVPPPTQIDPMMDMMISSRGDKPCSEDLGLSLHPFEVPSGTAAKWDSGPAGFAFETDSYPRAGSTSWSNDSSATAENTRDGFLYSTNDNLMAAVPFPPGGTLQSSTPPALHAFDGFSIGPEDHHKAQAIIQQSFLFGNRFGSDGYPGFSLPSAQQINDEDDCNISFSRPSSFYAWSNSGHSLLKRK